MDQKKIGSFMKELRKQKGLTQEQLAEQFGVSDRTVSRWENGNNMPDLSLLVEMADYYDVDIRELIDGERKSEKMESELKDTLQKVADYGDSQKRKTAEAGSNAFGIAFIIGAVTIIVQMLIRKNLSFVFGETIMMLAGGIAYLLLVVKNGVFESTIKGTKKNYTLISAICSGVYSIVIFLFLYFQKQDLARIIPYTVCFFVVIMIAGRVVLYLLSKASRKNNTSE